METKHGNEPRSTYLWLLVIVASVLVKEGHSQDPSSPLPEEVELGHSKTMTCENLIPDMCAWMTPGRMTITKLGPKPGYIVDVSDGKCTLTIESAKDTDDGGWTCIRLDAGEGVNFHLTVLQKPEQLTMFWKVAELDEWTEVIDHNKKVDVTEVGDFIYVLCKVNGGKPDPEMQWYFNGDMQSTPSGVSPDPDPGHFFSTTQVPIPGGPHPDEGFSGFSPQNRDKETRVNCTSMHRNQVVENIGTVFARNHAVSYVEIFSNSTNFVEGEYVHLTCKSDGHPEPEEGQISFYKMDGNVPPQRVFLVHGTDHLVSEAGQYSCGAKNSLPSGTAHQEMPEHYSRNTIDIKPKAVEDESTSGSNDSLGSANAGTIAGIVIGALVILAVIGGVTYVMFKKEMLCFKENHSGEYPTAPSKNGVKTPNEEETKVNINDTNGPEGVDRNQ